MFYIFTGITTSSACNKSESKDISQPPAESTATFLSETAPITDFSLSLAESSEIPFCEKASTIDGSPPNSELIRPPVEVILPDENNVSVESSATTTELRISSGK